MLIMEMYSDKDAAKHRKLGKVVLHVLRYSVF